MATFKITAEATIEITVSVEAKDADQAEEMFRDGLDLLVSLDSTENYSVQNETITDLSTTVEEGAET